VLVGRDARQSVVPAPPVADRAPAGVVARRRHDDDGPVERHEQLARRRRVQTDERVHRLPLGLTAVHRVEVLDARVANRSMHVFVVNRLDARTEPTEITLSQSVATISVCKGALTSLTSPDPIFILTEPDRICSPAQLG